MTTKEEWLEQRKTGIGGTAAPAILGLSPWKSPLSLWAEYSGLVEPPQTDNERMEWGLILEPVIADHYAKRTGRELRDPGRYSIVRSAEKPFMIGTIDREIMPQNGSGRGVLEIKTAGVGAESDWDPEPPVHYAVQLQHYLSLLNCTWGSFAVLIGGQHFHMVDVLRNDKFCSYLIEKEEEFWDRVQRGDPPPVDGSDSTKEVLARLYPKDSGETVELPPEAAGWFNRRHQLKIEAGLIEAELQTLENTIKAALGSATKGLLPDGTGFSWKSQHRAAYTVEDSDYRVLREIKPKARKQ